jgi:hypothetical protein
MCELCITLMLSICVSTYPRHTYDEHSILSLKSGVTDNVSLTACVCLVENLLALLLVNSLGLYLFVEIQAVIV